MQDLLRSDAKIALPTMFVAQSIMTMAAYAIPVVAPAAAPDIGISTVFVGGFTSLVYLIGMFCGLFSGALVIRFGTVRVMQILLLLTAAGTAAFNLSTIATAIFCAVAIGMANGPMNPAGSHVLARTTPPRWRAFVFSAKQCATPMGGVLAGVAMPALLLAYDWKVAVGTVAVAAVTVMILIQPTRTRLDVDRDRTHPVGTGSFLAPLRIAVSRPDLRALVIMGYIYAGAQVTFASYFVVFLTERVALSIASAGFLYAIFNGCGIPIRLFWGAIAERVLSSRAILILTGFCMAAGFALTARFDSAWLFAALSAVTALLGLSANGWVGLFFSEIVRIAPDDQAADASGGGQFFTYGGIMTMPLIFGGLVAATGEYTWPFYLLAVLCFIGALQLLLTRPQPAPA